MGTTTATAVRPAPVRPPPPPLLPEFPSFREGSVDDVAGGPVVVPVGVLVRDAVDGMVMVVFEPPPPLSSVPVDVGGVEVGGSSAVVVGSSGVVVGGT